MKALMQLLSTCEALLCSVGETFWANKIEAILKKGEGSFDLYLLDEILSWYGSMGSFSDLMISEQNHHAVKPRDEEKLNDDLSRLRNEIYKETVRLKRG